MRIICMKCDTEIDSWRLGFHLTNYCQSYKNKKHQMTFMEWQKKIRFKENGGRR